MSLSLKYKEQGNQAFKEKKYHKAINLYTKSLTEKADPVVFGNRAQSELNAKLPLLAFVDADKAIQLDKTIAKNFYRRALACQSLGLHERARSDAEKCFQLSKDPSAKKLSDQLKGMRNEPIMSVPAIERDEFLTNADEEFVEVAIETDAIIEATPSSSLRVEAEPTKIPQTPSNFGDFTTAFHYLEQAPELFSQYFMKIDPSIYNQLFDDLIEPSMVSLLLKGFASSVPLNPSTSSEVVNRLIALANVSRFDLVSMMLGAVDKRNLSKISEHVGITEAALLMNKYC